MANKMLDFGFHGRLNDTSKVIKNNTKAYKSIKGVMLVVGYHFGVHPSNSKINPNKPYVSHKPYVFVVNGNTRHLDLMKVGNSAKVETARGKRNLLVTELHNKKSLSKRELRHIKQNIKPVLDFMLPPAKSWFVNATKRNAKKYEQKVANKE